jgi:hypothetical protein
MPDLDEIVTWPGVGSMSLGSAVRRIRDLPPPPPGTVRQTSLFRDAGLSPSIYDHADIERMFALLD